MGCPDWPKCFGLYSPPGCECQLPHNYQQIFLEKRIAKAERFAKILDKLGMTEKAKLIREDEKIYVPEEFNVAKAWTEYINRIFGVISGLLALAFFVMAFLGRFSAKTKMFATFGFLMLVGNAWLGSIVVATNLLPGIVTLHFLLSFLCAFFFLLAMHSNAPFTRENMSKGDRTKWIFMFVLVMAEVFLGTLARESVEYMKTAGALTGKGGMLDYNNMGINFAIHRFLPGAILILSLYFGIMRRREGRGILNDFNILAIMVLIQICLGAINIVVVLPAYAQVLHILIGSIMPVYCFYKWLQSNSGILLIPSKP